jgi:hypothetical protein
MRGLAIRAALKRRYRCRWVGRQTRRRVTRIQPRRGRFAARAFLRATLDLVTTLACSSKSGPASQVPLGPGDEHIQPRSIIPAIPLAQEHEVFALPFGQALPARRKFRPVMCHRTRPGCRGFPCWPRVATWLKHHCAGGCRISQENVARAATASLLQGLTRRSKAGAERANRLTVTTPICALRWSAYALSKCAERIGSVRARDQGELPASARCVSRTAASAPLRQAINPRCRARRCGAARRAPSQAWRRGRAASRGNRCGPPHPSSIPRTARGLDSP